MSFPDAQFHFLTTQHTSKRVVVLELESSSKAWPLVLGTGHTFLLLMLVSAFVLQLADSLSRGCCCKAQVCELQLQGRKLMSQSLTTSQPQPQPSAQDETSHTEVDGIHLSPHFLRRRDEPH